MSSKSQVAEQTEEFDQDDVDQTAEFDQDDSGAESTDGVDPEEESLREFLAGLEGEAAEDDAGDEDADEQPESKPDDSQWPEIILQAPNRLHEIPAAKRAEVLQQAFALRARYSEIESQSKAREAYQQGLNEGRQNASSEGLFQEKARQQDEDPETFFNWSKENPQQAAQFFNWQANKGRQPEAPNPLVQERDKLWESIQGRPDVQLKLQEEFAGKALTLATLSDMQQRVKALTNGQKSPGDRGDDRARAAAERKRVPKAPSSNAGSRSPLRITKESLAKASPQQIAEWMENPKLAAKIDEALSR